MVNGIGFNPMQPRETKPPLPPPEIKEKLTAAGVPDNIISQGPEAVKQHLDSQGLTPEDIGLPAPPLGGPGGGAKGPPPNKEEIHAKLSAAGIPDNIIQGGPQSVRQYLEANNIDPQSLGLPPGPPPGMGQNLNLIS